MCKILEKVPYGESTLQFIRHQIPFNYSNYDMITVNQVDKYGEQKRLGMFSLCEDRSYTYYDNKRTVRELSMCEMFSTLNSLVDTKTVNNVKTETNFRVSLRKYITIEVLNKEV